jgi:hypothetical protein
MKELLETIVEYKRNVKRLSCIFFAGDFTTI